MNPNSRAKRALLRERRLQTSLRSRYRRYGCMCGRHSMREEALLQYWHREITECEADIMSGIIAKYEVAPLPPLFPRS